MPFPSKESHDHLCGKCYKKRGPFASVRSVAIYDGILREAIHRFKYNGKTSLAAVFGEMMKASIADHDYDTIVPVPLHRKRLKERGFNQSLLLAKSVAKGLDLPVDYLHLKRVRETSPQVGLTVVEREGNVKGVFRIEGTPFFAAKNVLLIDDVITTGATVAECSRVLKEAGCKRIDVLTLARVVFL